MSVDCVALGLVPGGARAALREICGYDEESVCGSDTLAAVQLLDRLLADVPGFGPDFIGPGCAAELTASDRDRLLAAVYARTYGPCVESTVRCCRCDELFDLDFSLRELIASLESAKEAEAAVEAGVDGTFGLSDGRRFRLPTGEDEYTVSHLPPGEAEKELLARCVVEGDPWTAPEAVQAAMEEIAPVLDLELDAQCPECGAPQAVHFNIQSYLLTALEAERGQFAREVHRLATAYGWSRQEILAIPRSRRRAYVALIEAEMVESRRWYG